MVWLADLVLTLHFAMAAFIALGLILVPCGAVMGWQWIRSRRLRLLHAGLMAVVAAEAVLGVVCPLTVLEAALRGSTAPEWFWAHQLNRWLYWDLPPGFFLLLYGACTVWVVWMWRLFPPRPRRHDQRTG